MRQSYLLRGLLLDKSEVTSADGFLLVLGEALQVAALCCSVVLQRVVNQISSPISKPGGDVSQRNISSALSKPWPHRS